MAIDLSVLSKLTDAVDAVRTFAEKAAGADDEKANTGGSAVPGDSPATLMARNARQSYQKTARWMLAAFATVGVLIFGSLPFAAVADVKITWPGSLWLVGGLVLAVAGIVGAVIAVSLVSEPEDASLGELDCDLRAVQKVDKKGFVFKDGKPVIAVPKWRALWNPRLACRIELTNILHGEDSAAHLGPNLVKEGHATVADLIKMLGRLEAEHAALAPVVADKSVTVAVFEKRTADLTALVAELRTQRGDTPNAELDERIAETSATYATAATKLDAARQTLATKMADLAEVDNRLALFHDHRELVLAEAGVMQLRGRFRLARRILAVAAVLTLFGGTGYALALPGATETKAEASAPPATAPTPTARYATGLPATIVVHEGTKPAAELPRDCVDRALPALWVGDTRIPSTVGPFTAMITDPACVGQVTVARGEGTFALTR
jgi:cell wall-associated NlpC family hydrolase